jgi:hypothetical protein
MTKNELKAVESFNRMWSTWKKPTRLSIEDSENYWAEKDSGFGSGLTEIWRSIDDIRSYFEEVFVQTPNGFIVHTKWIETNLISDEIVLLWGEMIIEIKLPFKNMI